MTPFKLIAVDTVKGHVTVSYSDNVPQTMCDCPLTSVEERDTFLSEYGDRYEAAIVLKPIVTPGITSGIGTVVTPKIVTKTEKVVTL